MQYRFLCTKSRHTMINLAIFHACFKKYINFPVFWCIFGFAKTKQYAVRPPSILYIFFSKFLSQKKKASCFKCFNLHAKQTYIHADWSASLYTALVSNVMRTCKGASVQVDRHVYFLLHPYPRRRRTGKGAAYVLNINLLTLFLYNSKFTCSFRQ